MKPIAFIVGLMVMIIFYIWDFLIPHFVTEEIAIEDHGDSFAVVGPLYLLNDEATYNGIATSRALVWLFWAFFAQIDNFREA